MEIAAFVCSHVFNKTAPVLLVSKEGGDWQFVCGAIHNPGDNPRVVGLNHLTDDDPSLNEILDLPDDWEAEREAPTSPWRKSKIKKVT